MSFDPYIFFLSPLQHSYISVPYIGPRTFKYQKLWGQSCLSTYLDTSRPMVGANDIQRACLGSMLDWATKKGKKKKLPQGVDIGRP
jgi:hypothetical protein